MRQLYDQIGREITLEAEPERIVSTVPSQTALLVSLGLESRLVGRTRFCTWPGSTIDHIPDIGGTKDLKVNKILDLNPDLIIANKEENKADQILELSEKVPVWCSDVKELDSALDMISRIGVLCSKEDQANALLAEIREGLESLPTKLSGSVLYLIWKSPWMSVGGETFINDMLERTGLENVCKDYTRYPSFETGELRKLQPDYVFLSSEPYPFKHQHIEELEELLPKSEVLLVDGAAFSWYGSHLVKSVTYLRELIDDLSH